MLWWAGQTLLQVFIFHPSCQEWGLLTGSQQSPSSGAALSRGSCLSTRPLLSRESPRPLSGPLPPFRTTTQSPPSVGAPVESAGLSLHLRRSCSSTSPSAHPGAFPALQGWFQRLLSNKHFCISKSLWPPETQTVMNGRKVWPALWHDRRGYWKQVIGQESLASPMAAWQLFARPDFLRFSVWTSWRPKPLVPSVNAPDKHSHWYGSLGGVAKAMIRVNHPHNRVEPVYRC